jgi:hypothetical protein
VHYTPKHGSWLNQAEMEVSMFSRQCLGKRRIEDIAALRKQARAWNRRVNKNKARIQWKFTRRQAKKHFTTQSRGQSISQAQLEAIENGESPSVSLPAG